MSELAMIGHEAEAAGSTPTAGFPMLPRVEGHEITVDLVDDALDALDDRDHG